MMLLFYVTVLVVSLQVVNCVHHRRSHDNVEHDPSDNVKLSVFYESLCPDSIKFIKNQLMPTYNKLSNIMEVDLIPYGKASYKREAHRQWQFNCQHGPAECKGNMVQACAIHIYPKTHECLPFINCAMSSQYPPDAGQRCANKHGLNWEKISNCANGIEGENVLHAMGVKTDSIDPKLHFVPWILINGRTSENILDLALTNLLKLVCITYKGEPTPSPCSSDSS